MEDAITYDDILLIPSYNHWESRKVVDVAIADKSGKLRLDLPLMTANMDSVTEDAMANFIGAKGGIGVIHRFITIEANVGIFKACQERTFVSIGCSPEDLERAEALRDAGADLFCIDVAHAHARYVGKTLKKIRDMLGREACIMAGNVATYAGADYLASLSADIVKVGIGPGSICTTRIVAGVGVPQITAVANVADALRDTDVPVIADGGLRYSGDIAKVLVAGAHCVMVGGLFAGTDESPGDVEIYQGRSYKSYRGMGSIGAMSGKQGSSDRYFQEGTTESDKLVPEGIEGRVPYKGPLVNIITQLTGGVRASMGYTGCATIEEMRTKPQFVRVTNAGMRESHVHDVTITKEAPNYRVD